MTKHRSKRKVKYWVIFEWLGAVALIGVLILLLIWYKRDYTAIEIEDTATVYFLGEPYIYEPGTQVIYADDVVSIEGKQGENERSISSTPVIMKDGKKILLPTDMSYQTGVSNRGAYRVNHFTTLSNHDQGAVVLENEDLELSVGNGFLYDGKDLYIFFEPMTLCIGESRYELEPLSYVKAVYQDSIEIYNSADNSFNWLSVGTSDVTVESKSGYVIMPGTDTIQSEGIEWILFSAVENLELIQSK